MQMKSNKFKRKLRDPALEKEHDLSPLCVELLIKFAGGMSACPLDATEQFPVMSNLSVCFLVECFAVQECMNTFASLS